MTASLLPNGKQQFLDGAGVPLASGLVHFYIPTTTTPKDTWQDPDEMILNTNPVILDASGEALIYGDGQYRQVVVDSLGNTIWDQLTNSTLTATSISITAGDGNIVTDPDPLTGIGTISMADMPTNTIKGNNTNSLANPTNLTATQALALLGVGSPTQASLIGDVALNDITKYFDGPSIAQGTTGTWVVLASLTLTDTSAAASINVKLGDGTVVIASTQVKTPAANSPLQVTLGGIIANPVGNLRISAQDTSSTSGKILFNASGNVEDSTITAFRIA